MSPHCIVAYSDDGLQLTSHTQKCILTVIKVACALGIQRAKGPLSAYYHNQYMFLEAWAYLLEVEVYHRNEVQGVSVMVVVRVSTTVIHPQLDESTLTGHHMDCRGNDDC